MLLNELTHEQILDLSPKLVYEWIKTNHWSFKDFEKYLEFFEHKTILEYIQTLQQITFL